MNLKEEFQALAVELINSEDAFLSVAQTVILSQPILQNYDEESGNIFTSSDEYTCKGIVGPWKNSREQALNSDAVQTEDLSCLIQFKDLPLNLRIGTDTVTLPDTTQYIIVYKETDPAEATVNLRLSKILEP